MKQTTRERTQAPEKAEAIRRRGGEFRKSERKRRRVRRRKGRRR